MQLRSWGKNIAPMQEAMAQFERECPKPSIWIAKRSRNTQITKREFLKKLGLLGWMTVIVRDGFATCGIWLA